MGKRVAYLRVSTPEQRHDRQFDGLKDICDELHVEQVSATNKSRPVFEQVIAHLQPGDTFIVWDLDRAFRSVLDAIQTAEKLRKCGVGFQIATLLLDTETPVGEYAYTMLAAAAQFERRILIKRTKEGLEAARRRGKRLGRPPKLTQEQLEFACAEIEHGRATTTELANGFGVAPWTLSRSIKRLEQANQFSDDLANK